MMVRRRLGREPLQYILGRWDFFGRPFYVGEGVVGPPAGYRGADGTGAPGPSGYPFPPGAGTLRRERLPHAVTLSLERPDAEVWSVEKSGDAFPLPDPQQ